MTVRPHLQMAYPPFLIVVAIVIESNIVAHHHLIDTGYARSL